MKAIYDTLLDTLEDILEAYNAFNVGGQQTRETLMNLFGGITTLLLLLNKLLEKSILDPEMVLEIKERLIKLQETCPRKSLIREQIEKTISIYTK